MKPLLPALLKVTFQIVQTGGKAGRLAANNPIYTVLKRSAQVQYNYNTTAIQEFFLYCSCNVLVRTALERFLKS